MKIALVILHADPARGGAERYTVDLAAALAKRGHEVRVIASSFADEISPEMRVPIETGAMTRVGAYRRFLDGVDGHLDETKYDVVHAMLPIRRCDVYHPHAGMAVESARKLSSLFNPRRRAMSRTERELLNEPKPPIVIALSEYVKRSIRRFYELADARLATLFNAVDLDRFDPSKTHEDKWSEVEHYVGALMIANDFARKGLREAILALGRLHAQIYLQVVGKPNPRRYRRLARRKGVEHATGFLGVVKDPVSTYASYDFFVLPTKHDPCSLVVLEALAMGLPVISTRFNGACEIMTDGVHGFVLDDPSDIKALAAAMKTMLDPQRRAAMSRACLELRPKLSYEHHLDQLEVIYKQAARGGESPT